MPGDRRKRPAVLTAWWMVLAMPLAGGSAAAQNSSYISNNTSVIVDTDVLESLGGRPLGVDRIAAPSPRQAVDVQRSVPLPARAQLPSPATAPRSRLNIEALARLGLTRIPPAAPKQQTVAKPVVPAPKSRAAVVAPPAPAVAPKPAATQATVTTPSPARQSANVPAPPVLPSVQAPAPTAARQTTTQASVTPPPPPAPPSPATEAKTVPLPAVAAALVPPKQPALTPPKQAARGVAAVGGDDDGLRLLFDNGSARLSDTARSNLQSLTAELGANDALQVQLVAYAEGTAETSSQARRLSLSRALAVRSFLIDKGVRSTRMDIRALGNKAEDGPADRVDVVLVQK